MKPRLEFREVEKGSYCLMSWEGPCPLSASSFYTSNHDCEVTVDHKGPHRCDCGKSKRLAEDDPKW